MKEELRKEIGQRLRQFREKLGTTQRQMATNFGIGHANYSRIERGEIFPGILVLDILKKKFDLSLHWLICDQGDMLTTPADEENRIDIGSYSQDIKELIHYITDVPMVKHAILGFFMEYKVRNEDILKKVKHSEE